MGLTKALALLLMYQRLVVAGIQLKARNTENSDPKAPSNYGNGPTTAIEVDTFGNNNPPVISRLSVPVVDQNKDKVLDYKPGQRLQSPSGVFQSVDIRPLEFRPVTRQNTKTSKPFLHSTIPTLVFDRRKTQHGNSSFTEFPVSEFNFEERNRKRRNTPSLPSNSFNFSEYLMNDFPNIQTEDQARHNNSRDWSSTKDTVNEKFDDSRRKKEKFSSFSILKDVLRNKSLETNTNKTSALDHSRRFRELTKRRKYSMNFVKSQNFSDSDYLNGEVNSVGVEVNKEDSQEFVEANLTRGFDYEEKPLWEGGKTLSSQFSHQTIHGKIAKESNYSFGKSDDVHQTDEISIINHTTKTPSGVVTDPKRILAVSHSFEENPLQGSSNAFHSFLSTSQGFISIAPTQTTPLISTTKRPPSSNNKVLFPFPDQSSAMSLTPHPELLTTPFATSRDLFPPTISPSTSLQKVIPPSSFQSRKKPLTTSRNIFLPSNYPATPLPKTVPPTSLKPTPTADPWPVKLAAEIPGDLILGGLMMVHEREDSVTCGPIMPQGGIQALETMLYTLDVVNNMPGAPFTLGAHILDDCDKDTYGLEMAVDFIKGSISNIDDAEFLCNKTQVRKVISGVVGAASSVTSIQVANLLRLFKIPQVSFFSTSPELSNKQRFEYFTRTIPSDHHQVKAMVEIVRRLGWSYVSIIYEESNYGIKFLICPRNSFFTLTPT